jgi:hypothetical protein
VQNTTVLCLDFEASGIARFCYPIEVAVADVETGETKEWLIAPTPTWLEKGVWQTAAQDIHGLTLSEIIANGRSAQEVAAELTAAVQGATVLSDSPPFDTKWLRDLYAEVGTEPPFVLLDFNQFAWQAALTRGRRPDIAYSKAETEASMLFPIQHRAAPDAQRNAEMLRQIWGNAPAR